MKPFLFPAVAALILAGCGPQLPQGASAELSSVLRFAEYPGATLVGEAIASSNLGPYGMPGNSGSRLYETQDPPEAIRGHYERLATEHGWLFDSPGGSVDTRFEGMLIKMSHERFSFIVSVFSNRQPLDGPYFGGPYPARPFPEPSPSVSPEPEPTPAPTPHPGPWYIRVDAEAQRY